MGTITAADIAKLRSLTDCGMMDCKKALEETQGDMNKAVEILRIKGMAKAAKKAGRVATEGIIGIKTSANNKEAIVIEVNCETDFVSRDKIFSNFVNTVTDIALKNRAENIETLINLMVEGNKTVEQLRQELVSKVGENIQIKRVAFLQSDKMLGSYVHSDRIGVLVSLNADNPELSKDIAMHIAASKPNFVSYEEVPNSVISKEKEIFLTQAKETGKPQNIIEKMAEGRMKKFLDEICLVGQPFIKDTNITVGKLLENNKAKVVKFIRFELGETI